MLAAKPGGEPGLPICCSNSPGNIVTTILDRIVASKREEVIRAKGERSLEELRRAAAAAPPARDFLAALRRSDRVGLIAEIKKASPSKGVIREDFDPVAIAKIYEAAGADCLSVLTDAPFFQGHLNYLRAVRAAVSLPLLRKDFIIDPYQILEAREAGADAVLLIAECLEAAELAALREEIEAWGMTALVELHDPEELPKVLACGARLVGVNNRDLRTFQVDLDQTVRLRGAIPETITLVGESGIRTSADVHYLRRHRVDAILVGESLMASPDIGAAVRQLLA